MGRSDDNISFRKSPFIMHIPVAQLGGLTLPAGHSQRQSISPLLVSDQSRDTASRSRGNVPPGPSSVYYPQSQSRDVFTRSGAVGGSSAYNSAGVDWTAHFTGGISNRDFLVEDSVQRLQDTAFQSPVMVVPSYTTNATTQSYEGNAIHPSRLQHATPPSGIGASARSFANDRYRLDIGPPAQVSGGIPDRNSVLADPVSLRPDTVSRPFSSTPSYGTKAITPIYEGDVRHVLQSHTAESSSRSTVFYDPAYRSSDHSPYGQAPPHPPLPLPSSIQAFRTDTSHPSAHQPTLFAEHIDQAVSFRKNDAQQSGSPQAFLVDGCFIDEDDLTDEGINDIIIVGECLRKDSPCDLWVKADKGSIKRHAQKWHGVARGSDTNIVSCTWAGCNTEMQKSAVPRHTLCKHFHETFQCNGCLRYFTRDYSCRSHAAKCMLSGYGYRVTYGSSTRAINVKGLFLKQVGY